MKTKWVSFKEEPDIKKRLKEKLYKKGITLSVFFRMKVREELDNK